LRYRRYRRRLKVPARVHHFEIARFVQQRGTCRVLHQDDGRGVLEQLLNPAETASASHPENNDGPFGDQRDRSSIKAPFIHKQASASSV